MKTVKITEAKLHRIVSESVKRILKETDFKTWHEEIPVFFNGEPFHGRAAFINGYNGYESSKDDGCLCALIKDERGVPSCWGKDGKPNYITNQKGTPIRLKNRRGTTTNLNGTLHVDYEDAYANGSNPSEFGKQF